MLSYLCKDKNYW